MTENDRPRRTRADYERGLPDHHDPTAGLGPAPARSALTLRALLAAFGLVFCAVAAWIAFGTMGVPVVGWIMVVIAVVALVDLGVVLNRKRRGEPG